MKHPQVTWLVDSADPTGSTVLAARRMTVLRGQHNATALAVTSPLNRLPSSSPLRGIGRLGGLAGELRIAQSDLVVTTTERSLASAAPRLSPRTRLVHFVHTAPEIALRSDRFMRTVPRISRVVVPAHVDADQFAERAGLPAGYVATADDFTLADESLLGTARAKVILAAGVMGERSGILQLAEGFRQALPHLPGWQLRIAGWGLVLPELVDFVEAHGLQGRLIPLGARHDLAEQYLDAGVVVRIEAGDAYGLSVLEALAAGVPVIGSAGVPAVHRHVRNGENGLVLDRVDPGAVAEALVEIADPTRRAELATAARSERAGLIGATAVTELADIFTAALDTPRRDPIAEPTDEGDPE